MLRFLVLLCLSLQGVAYGAITANINSGNPRYPFPQFKDYGLNRVSLASVNPVGVPHAEMEQRTRDAYQIFANEWNSTADSWGGVQYIDPYNPPGDPYDTSEGAGYALLAAAYMADKPAFDGLWMRMHDVKLEQLPRYRDGVTVNPGYLYGNLPKDNTNSAADGDYDMALAILMAWYQWGDNMGITAFNGTPISYKAEALRMINALVEVKHHFPAGDCRSTSGDIGYDGYFKGGDTWTEMTNWATGQCPDGPEFAGPQTEFFDYEAPAYFHCFSQFLQAQAQPAFNVGQFQRAEASSDWLMGQLYSQSTSNVPIAAGAAVAGVVPTFSQGNILGEDFRAGWRTILNYVWNGNPASSWNPANTPAGHQVVAGANSYEYDMAIRFANFIRDTRQAPWNQACRSFGSSPSTYWGVPAFGSVYNMDGSGGPNFHLNRFMGTGAPAALASQDFHLMAEIFRECVTVWDGNEASQQYLGSLPLYFHGWMRLLGMQILTGNHPDPCDLVAPGGTPPANLKIYKSVDRTYAAQGDTLTYWISYRNYASTAATTIVIMDTLPAELGFVSAVPAPASAPAPGSNGIVRWNLASLPGLQNQNYAATEGGLTLVAQVLASSGRTCNTTTISCANGSGWTSNEYPNHQTDVMERNCVDIIPAALSLTKSASPSLANPGDTITYTLSYQDNPAPWLNGGRPGVVVSVGNDGISASANYLNLKFRVGHGADEPLINYKNYRISYYTNDPSLPTYVITNVIAEGAPVAGTVLSQQNLIAGGDAFGKWNQRFMIQFPSQQAVPEPQLYDRYNSPQFIHEGAIVPFRFKWRIALPGPVLNDWSDDWSADALDGPADGAGYYPVTNDWTDPYNPNVPVTHLHPHACATSTYEVTRILVEEWDGYTWRRAFGNGPVSGREMNNVVISDTLPAGVAWGGFVGAPGTKTGNVLSWNLPLLRIGEAGQVKFWVTLNNAASFGGCPVNTVVSNSGKITADNESPVFSSAGVSVTCNALPTPVPAFNKFASPASVNVGQNITYVLSYNAPDPLGQVNDDFSSAATMANWNSVAGAAGFGIAGGVMKPSTWGGGTELLNGTSAVNTTATAHLQMESFASSGIVLRGSGSTYYYVKVLVTNNGQSQISLQKSIAGTITNIQSTGANLAIANSAYYGLRVMASGSSFNIEYDTGGGWINPFGGPIVDASIAGPGLAGIRTDNSINGDWTDFSATLDRMAGVSISDTTPANTTFVSGNTAPTLNPAVGGTGLVSWTLGTVIAGTTYSRTMTVQVSACPGGGIVVNQAYLAGVNAYSNNVTTTVTCGTPTMTPNTSPTSSPTRTSTLTLTPTATPSATPSSTQSPSPSVTVSPSPSATPSPSPTRSATASATPSNSASPTVSASATRSNTPLPGSPTQTSSSTPTPSISATATPSASPSAARSATPSFSPSQTLTASASATPSASPSRTASPAGSPTFSPTPSSSFTETPVLTPTPSFSVTSTPSVTLTPSPTASMTSSPSASQTRTASATLTATSTLTATASVTPTATPSRSFSPSPSPSATRSASQTSTATPTASLTRTASLTPTISATASVSPTISVTFTVSQTFTQTPVKYYEQPELIQERGVYPNPFKDSAHLFFTLRVAATVKVIAYNVAGEIVTVLTRPCGSGVNELSWDGSNDSGGRCASGIYLLHLKADGVDASSGSYWTNLAIAR